MEITKMDLRTYLFFRRITLKSFAEIIEYSTSQISEVMHGRRKPGKRLAKAIERATAGEVTAEELLNTKVGNDKDKED